MNVATPLIQLLWTKITCTSVSILFKESVHACTVRGGGGGGGGGGGEA